MSAREPGAGHTAFEELAAGYALHALEPEEEQRFRDHLATCAACRRAVDEHLETLAALGSTEAADPPASVLEGIRAGVAAEPRGLPPVLPLDQARARRRSVTVGRGWLLGAAAGVAAVLMAVGVWVGGLRSELDEQTSRADRLAAAVEALESPGARTVQLTGPDGEVRAVVIAHGQQMSLVVDGLAANPVDTVYVLWGQTRSGDVRAVSTFDVGTGEVDVLRGLPLQLPVEELAALMVTHEKGRTPPAQTEQPVLAAGEV